MEEWRAAAPGNWQGNYPLKLPRYSVDRTGSSVYGLFWNNRMLKLGKTVWTSPAPAIAVFNNYVTRVLRMLEEDEISPLAEELAAFAKERGHRTVKDITAALRECGVLQVRELETIPMPPDEE